MDLVEIHEKIIGVLKEKGPSLPINIAKALEISTLFVSAFLSELTNQKRVKVSNLKVGGSPLYYIAGQEEKLENYYKYLHPRESEAFLLLKEHKVLKDSDQDPATRVALRSIKDFSVGFNIGDEIYWRFVSVPIQDANNILNGNNNIVKEKIVIEEKTSEKTFLDTDNQNPLFTLKIQPPIKNEVSEKFNKSVIKNENQFKNPLVISEAKKKKEKPRSEFVDIVINFIKSKNLEVVEEMAYKSKENNCIVKIRSELGPINFLTQAKDKKTINEGDFKKLLSSAQSIPLPALMLYNGEINKMAKNYLRDYSSVLKAKRIT